MKKLADIWIVGAVACALAVIGTVRLFVYHPVVPRVAAGDGRTFSKQRRADVYVDDTPADNAFLFEDGRRFYVVFDGSVRPGGVDMLIVEPTLNDVSIPNGGGRDVLFSRWLFVADASLSGVPLASPKADGFDARLVMNENGMTFLAPGKGSTQASLVEIVYRPE